MTWHFGDLRRVPHSALLLGFAGALPFIVGSLLTFMGPPASSWAAVALPAYGAVVLSFMAGIHWGLAMSRREMSMVKLATSVLPAMVAWLSLLTGGRLGYFVLAAAFAVLLAYDIFVAREQGAPDWYSILRWPLTVIVILCLLLGTLGI